MSEESVDLDFKQIAGPGVAGTEHDVPVHHFDIIGADLPEMLADPVGFLAKRGVQEYIDKDPGTSMQVVMQSSDPQMVEAEATVRWCCYDIGTTRTCHRHN